MYYDAKEPEIYSRQTVFETEAEAEEHKKRIGGGYVHRLFDYLPKHFTTVVERSLNGKVVHKFVLNELAERKYYGWHVHPYAKPKVKKAA